MMEIKQLLTAINTDAEEALQNLVFPNANQEDWKYIDLTPIKEIPWGRTLEDQSFPGLSTFPEAEYQLIFHNNVFQPERSVVCQEELLVLGSIKEEGDFSPLLSAHLGQYIDSGDVLTQINSKFCQDLSFIYAPPHFCRSTVISLNYGNQGHHCASHPRCLIVLAPHSRLTIVEVHQGNDDIYWSNPVTEIHLGEQAQLTHVILQHQGLSAFHTKTTRVMQTKNSSYHLQTIDLGGHLSRHNLHVLHQGDSTILEGLVAIGASQTSDTHSTIVHSHPGGRSSQLHKCILQDCSHGVFNGRICVTKEGQMTDACQMSRNLLLSPHARIDTKPQLEIVADNVKCSHGATVSQLDRDEQFYLQSRGIDLEAATKILTYAFAGEVIQHIPIPSVGDFVAKLIQ